VEERERIIPYYQAGNYSSIIGIPNSDFTSASFYTNISFHEMIDTPAVTVTNDQGTAAATNITNNSVSLGRSNSVASRSNSGTYILDARP
jgi:hypothetical protein